ncbi:MAG: extracellular solute-binding protein [bacterium]
MNDKRYGGFLRRLCGVMLLAGSVVVMSLGCSGGGEEQAPRSATNGGAKIGVTTNNGAEENDEKRLAEQKIVAGYFNQNHSNALLKFSTWQYSPETFLAKFRSKTATDVVGLFATEGTVLIERKMALDLTDMVKSWEHFDSINKEVLEPFSRDGRIYGLPVGGIGGGYVMTLFYNKKLFKASKIVDDKGEPKPPQTWEEFVEMALKLTDREKGVAGFGILGDDAAGWHLLNWVWQSGGDFERRADGKWKAVFNEPQAVVALQFIKDLKWKHDVLQHDLLATNDDLFELFAAEKIAMAIFTPEYLLYIVDKLGYPIENIGITLLPAGPAGRVNQMGGGYMIIPSYTPPERARLALDAMLQEYDPALIEKRLALQSRQKRLVGLPALPVFHGAYQDGIQALLDKYRNVPAYPGLMEEAVKYVRAEPPFYSNQLYHEILSPLVQEVLTNHDANPKALLDKGAKRFQERFLDKMNEGE